MITSITNPYPSMSRHCRSIIRASCLASCNYHSFGGDSAYDIMSALMATIFQHLYMQCICILSLIRLDYSAILSIWLHSAAPSGMHLNSFVSLVPLYPSKRRRLSSSSTQQETYHTFIPYTHIHIFGWNICLLHAYIHTFWPMYGPHVYISLLVPILSLLGPMCGSTHIYT